MIITRHRTHTVNMTHYEAVKFGASVTIDTEADKVDLTNPAGLLNRILDDLLQEDMDEAIANVPEGETTHAETWRK